MRFLHSSVAVCFLYLVLPIHAKDGRTKSVVVSLDSKWPYTPILLEASEFVAKESNALFWRFVDAVSGKEPVEQLKTITEQELYEWITRLAETLLPAARVDLMKFALSIRAHSPAVEMHRQIALTVTASNGLDVKDEKCHSFIEFHDRTLCLGGVSEEKLKEFLEKGVNSEPPPVFVTDHHYPGSRSGSKRVILYAEIGTEAFSRAHKILKKLAQSEDINYVLRHFSGESNEHKRRVRLSCYGVELAIKSTEYKAQDDSKIKATGDDSAGEDEEETDLSGFNFQTLKKLHPELKDGLNEFKLHLFEADELTPLKVWQLQDLSFQAGQRVVSAPKSDALQVLQDLSQNFPMVARSLTRTNVKSEFRQEVEANQEKTYAETLGLQPGDAALFVNGLVVDLDSFDLFQLLELLKKEEQLASGFFRMGFRREYLTLLTNLSPEVDTSNYAIDFRPAFPEFINDLDSDKQYKEWGNSVKLMVQPYFPGMIRPIARNFFTLVFIVDPAVPASRSLLKIAFSFYAHQIPIRIGVVFVVNTEKDVSGLNDAGVALLNLFQFAKSDRDPAKALRMITELYDEVQEHEIKPADVIRQFKRKYPDEDVDLVFGPNSDYDKGRQAGRQFLENSGLGAAPKVLLNGIPLDDAGISADRFEETVINEVMKITPKIQREIMDGKLTDQTNVFEHLMNRPEVMPRLNNRILRPKEPTYLDLTDVMEYKANTLNEFSLLGDREANSVIIKTSRYLTRSDEPMARPITMWVVADLETPKGRALYYDALKHLKHSNKARLALIHNPNQPISDRRYTAAKVIHAAQRLLPLHQAKMVITKILQNDGQVTEKLEDLEVHGVNWQTFRKEFMYMEDELKNTMAIHSYYATNRLGLRPGARALIANGQIVGPFGEDEQFAMEDINLLEKYLCAKTADSIMETIKMWEISDEDGKSSDLVMRVSSLVSGDTTTKKKRYWVTFWGGDEHSGVSIPAADDTTSTFDIVAIVDPLSREAQKLAPLLSALNKVVNADLKLMMNPRPKLSEMPLKSFYRLVLQPHLEFDSKDGSVRAASSTARFTSLPRKQLLTLNLITPDAWLVEAKKALHDLDNIKMEQVESDVVAIYELEHLLLEGHCFDEVTGNPPRGLQFILGTQAQPYMVDTIVMANLGYFQLKANPGAWQLRLREGRSADIYDITTHDNTNSEPHQPTVTTLVDNFSGKIIRIRVAKKPDKINEHLLVDGKEEDQESIWHSISSKLTGKSGDDESTINIFTLASGHLYERFVRIMMLSVLKHATVPVKFWLLKNYLSPYFKEFLPYLAKKYNFSYELVQYRWPRWLHQQTEKQRLMWGYKILFLDVLFPLDVRKIIFVDADQVVRADMKQLMDLDLEGAPYGYTPFCDSRTEMDGFRFWKRGYWANHLAGRKYHISALYVVDLKKFRQIAAGDRLRGQYQGLSSDPNSLSNLDQDLPNNMVHQVKIKSLPQEWLWCETWCDERSKKYAKTIDLCNNPLTKEPKLESAMRIIDEWREYDDEIRRVQQEFEEKRGESATVGKPEEPKVVPEKKVDDHGGEL